MENPKQIMDATKQNRIDLYNRTKNFRSKYRVYLGREDKPDYKYSCVIFSIDAEIAAETALLNQSPDTFVLSVIRIGED